MVRTMRNVTRTGDEGATAVEYALMLAAIAAVIVTVVFILGDTVRTQFTTTNTCISNQGVGC